MVVEQTIDQLVMAGGQSGGYRSQLQDTERAGSRSVSESPPLERPPPFHIDGILGRSRTSSSASAPQGGAATNTNNSNSAEKASAAQKPGGFKEGRVLPWHPFSPPGGAPISSDMMSPLQLLMPALWNSGYPTASSSTASVLAGTEPRIACEICRRNFWETS